MTNGNDSAATRVAGAAARSCELVVQVRSNPLSSGFLGRLGYREVHGTTDDFSIAVDPECAFPPHKSTGIKTPAGPGSWPGRSGPGGHSDARAYLRLPRAHATL